MQQKDHPYKPLASDWNTGVAIWNDFTGECQFLSLRPGRWAFHNFLRNHRDAMIQADAIRLAKNRFWIAHRERFMKTAFELLTGQKPVDAAGEGAARGPAMLEGV